MPERSRTDMALRGRIGGFTKASRYPREELTAAARSGFLERFEREVDPDGLLGDTERARRAQAALRAYMARLAFRSATSRRNKGGAESHRPTPPTVPENA